MPTRYIVTLCYENRTHTKHFADMDHVQALLAEFFTDDSIVSFVVAPKDSPWRKARGLDKEED